MYSVLCTAVIIYSKSHVHTAVNPGRNILVLIPEMATQALKASESAVR